MAHPYASPGVASPNDSALPNGLGSGNLASAEVPAGAVPTIVSPADSLALDLPPSSFGLPYSDVPSLSPGLLPFSPPSAGTPEKTMPVQEPPALLLTMVALLALVAVKRPQRRPGPALSGRTRRPIMSPIGRAPSVARYRAL